MYWSTIAIEAYCFGEEDTKGNYPCGEDMPSPFCLLSGHCPHFGYTETTEREVAQYPKLYLIIYDRLKIWGDTLWWKLRWYFWDCLWFNRRKRQAFFDSIPIATFENCPEIAEIQKAEEQNALKFIEWFKNAQHTGVRRD